MKKCISILIASMMALQMLTVACGVLASDAIDSNLFVDTPEAVPNGNLLPGSSFDDPSVLEKCDPRKQNLEVVKNGDGGCLSLSGITVNYQGFLYKLDTPIEKGDYKFTAYFKTAEEGALTFIRVNFRDTDAKTYNTIKVYPKSDKWLKVETYITVTTNIADIWINGGNNGAYIQPYLIDNMSLEKVNSIPKGGNITSFGTEITPEQTTPPKASATTAPAAPTTPAASSSTAKPAAGQPAVFVDTPSAVPSGNILNNSDFDDVTSIKYWNAAEQKLDHVSDGDNGYLSMSNITINFKGFTYTPNVSVGAGNYRFIGYFKTQGEGTLTNLRVIFIDKAGKNITVQVYPKSDKWIKVEAYISLAADLKEIKISGGTDGRFIQPYFVDNFSLEAVDKIPAGVVNSFGTPVTAEEAEASSAAKQAEYKKYDAAAEGYEIQGIVINQDAASIVKSCMGVTKDDMINFVKQFEGTHVTDYILNVNSTIVLFPSETWTDYSEKYYQKTENGVAVDYSSDELLKAARYMYEELGFDYVSVFTEEFPKIGINPWLSFRMNDIHGHGEVTGNLLSDFYHEHPDIRRVQYDTRAGKSYQYAQDYSYELVRTHMLNLINESLNRYDVYGIELDYQRDIRLWRIGGEAEGVDILNGFMRDVNKLVSVYEEKYGHEIKISVRVASDVETTFEFGLDVMTWASEGIIDMITPTGRYESTDDDIPVAHWKSLLEPYGTVVAPCIDARVRNAATRKLISKHTFESMCGIAANMLSQGADKIYLFNYMRTLSGDQIDEDDRITTTDNTLQLSTAKGYFNMITTCGSYDKLMTVNRRIIPTYNDTNPLWETNNSQVPQSAMPNKAITLHIPVGDVPSGAKVTLKFSVSAESAAKEGNRPLVYVNSVPCTFEKAGYITEFTNNVVLSYTVPYEACADGYLTAQIIPTKEYLTVDHAEAYITAPETVAFTAKSDANPKNEPIPEAQEAAAASAVRTSPDVTKPTGTQGIVLRANADELSASKLMGTDVTDVVLTLGNTDPSGLIGALKAAGVKVYASVNPDNGAAEVKAVLDRLDVDGVELDFLLCNVNRLAASNSYGAFDTVTTLLHEVDDTITASGRNINVSVRVASDVMTNYYYGLDVSTWARKGLVDMICPSSLTASDTDMLLRLWYSILADYDVCLAPVIGKEITNKSGYGTFKHVRDTLAAEAMNMLSSGADKVSVHDVSADQESLKLIGSYEKLLAAPQRMIATYSDISMPWLKSDVQFPIKVSAGGGYIVRIPLGDTADGAIAKVRIAYSNYGVDEETRQAMVVYANSVLCTNNGAEAAVDPMTGYTLYTFTVPAEALNMGHLVLELMSNKGAATIIYAEVYVSY